MEHVESMLSDTHKKRSRSVVDSGQLSPIVIYRTQKDSGGSMRRPAPLNGIVLEITTTSRKTNQPMRFEAAN